MEESRKLLEQLSKDYEIIKNTPLLDKQVEENFLKNAIVFYSKYIPKTNFDEIIKQYKILYIYNESKVEEDITPEEQLGIGKMYDYINNFDFKKDKFNFFITPFLLHQILYSECNGKEFGGQLRDSNVFLQGTNIEIVDYNIAKKEFNKYISKSNEILADLDNSNLIEYIEKVVKIITDLIKLQPFCDGNKRTFRATLNLLLKRINLPPVYIDNKYKNEYKDALIKAMKYEDYNDMIKFYYIRIYDSIITLDINMNLIKKDELKRI